MRPIKRRVDEGRMIIDEGPFPPAFPMAPGAGPVPRMDGQQIIPPTAMQGSAPTGMDELRRRLLEQHQADEQRRAEWYGVAPARQPAPPYPYDMGPVRMGRPGRRQEPAPARRSLGWRAYLVLAVIGALAFMGWAQTVRLSAIEEAVRAAPVVQ